MGNVKRYLKERRKMYLLWATLFSLVFILVHFIVGPPIHYVVPTLALVTGFGLGEWFNYKAWKKNKY